MGFHICEYMTHEEAQQKGYQHIKAFYSSGDVTMAFDSGHSWTMPDMAPLYVEMGWVPPQAFIDDIMNHTLVGGKHVQTRGISSEHHESIGYLSPTTDPLPLTMNPGLPEGFLDRLAEKMAEATRLHGRIQTKGITFDDDENPFGTEPGYRGR